MDAERTTALTFEEHLLKEAFGAFLGEVRRAEEEAADGEVLDVMEGMIMGKGRDLLRQALQQQLQAAAEAAEKKGSRPARTAAWPDATKGRASVR